MSARGIDDDIEQVEDEAEERGLCLGVCVCGADGSKVFASMTTVMIIMMMMMIVVLLLRSIHPF